jgi:hypothetical protein
VRGHVLILESDVNARLLHRKKSTSPLQFHLKCQEHNRSSHVDYNSLRPNDIHILAYRTSLPLIKTLSKP